MNGNAAKYATHELLRKLSRLDHGPRLRRRIAHTILMQAIDGAGVPTPLITRTRLESAVAHYNGQIADGKRTSNSPRIISHSVYRSIVYHLFQQYRFSGINIGLSGPFKR